MENIYEKIEKELHSLSVDERNEILNKLRVEVDSLDSQLVKLLSRRTLHSVLIGRVKRTLGLPTYNPQREKDVANKIASYVEPPLSREALIRIYERILDESRAIQREEADKGNILKFSTAKIKNMKSMLSFKQFIAVAVFFLLVLAFLYYVFFSPNYYSGESPKKFEVKKGQTLTGIINNLYKEGIIPNKTNMKIAAFVFGAEKKIRAARYYIPNGLSYLDLVQLFISGQADFLRTVKIYDGVSLGWIASRLRYTAVIDSAAFINLATDKTLLDSLGIKASSLEGYLLPKQYDIYERSSPREVIDSLYKGFSNFIDDSIRTHSNILGYNLHQVITMASIIEGETNKPEEMPLIASVYFNRLRIGMRLQADPTVQYLQPGGWKRLNYDDLKVDNPYNTYVYSGLPPGPINNPGKTAIKAAFYPAVTKYVFFVADGKGGHKFAENYSQHLRNVKEYREWLNAQGK